ncbi:MAG: alpha-N-arabinofuranosidase [Clostridiales bacterium]|nr:alpha-N-arabinofuranosidase [Clostridiales bacterium]
MNKLKIKTNTDKGKISRYIYGQFAEHLGRCIYEGLYVGEESDIKNVNGMRSDVVNALKELDIPVLRWPGGCFADDYHWRDGIGERDKRPYMVNTNWGGVVENNHFGTHEFFELCDQLGAEPYICGNVGSGSVKEMRDWVEYMTFGGDSPLANERRANGREEPWKLKWFGVGNENWGCGGNMRPEYYSDLYRRYQTFIRNYGDEPIFKIAGGPDKFDYNWSETLMRELTQFMDGMSLHYYTIPGTWENKGDSIDFDERDWYVTMARAMRMEEAVANHAAVMDRYDPQKNVALIVDEWGTWYDVMPGTNPGFLYQQNTIRDVVSAMLTLHIFHKHNDRVLMANIAQMVNVLQAMVLTEGEKMVLTPTYYLFKLMKGHMDGQRLEVEYNSEEYEVEGIKVPKLSASASRRNGEITLSVCNTSCNEPARLDIDLDMTVNAVDAQMLAADNMNDYNDFDEPDKIVPKELECSVNGQNISVTLPPMSAAVLSIK